MPTTSNVVLAEGSHPAEGVSPPGSPVGVAGLGLALPPVRAWLETLLVSSAAIGLAWVLAVAPLLVVLPSAFLLAVALAAVAWRTQPAPLILGLIPATLVAFSGVVPAATYYVPAAVLALGLVLWTLRWSVSNRRLPPMPPRAFVAFGLLYLAAAGLAAIFSIRPTTSIPYVVAIAIVVPVSLWFGPWLLWRSDLGASLLVLIAAAGLAVTAIGLALSLTGPILWFDRWLGVYLAHELTVMGAPIGIIVLRISGPFLAPGGQSLVIAAAILATLALRPRLEGRRRTIASVTIAILVASLTLTLARVGWAAVIAGTGVLAIAPIRSRRVDVASGATCIVMTFLFVGLFYNAWGADYRPDITEARNAEAMTAASAGGALGGELQGDAVPEIPAPEVSAGTGDGTTPRIVARGGSELSGRLELWSASVRAIAHSPLVGYGPGTNAFALDPYLEGESRRLVGLTSHNTWLRTWVEFGIAGIIGLAGVAMSVIVAVVRRVVSGRRTTSVQLGMLAIFVGLAVSQAFETFLLGGVSLWSFAWSLAAGFLVIEGTGEFARTEVDLGP